MKKYWQRFSTKVDALTLRERTIIFAMTALALVTAINTFLLEPQLASQRELVKRIKTEQSQIAAIQAEIQQRVRPQANDPTVQSRAQIQALRKQLDQLHSSLGNVQKALVSPDRMPEVLQGMLKSNEKLQLLSMKTTEPEDLNELATDIKNPAKSEQKAKDGLGARESAKGAIYRHGVEITVQGSYVDILAYLAQLESLPWQLFWGKAVLNVENHPKASLTLTVFTLSLEKKWLNI